MNDKQQRAAFIIIGLILSMYQTASAYDKEALGTLKKSVAEWNAMRLAKSGETIDLSRAPLEKSDLSGARLDEVNLKGAFMKDVKLKEADLQGANLRWAMLENADFSRANVTNAFFFDTNLANAKLNGANFKGAQFFEQVNLDGATLSNNTILPSGKKATAQWSFLHNAKFVQEPEGASIFHESLQPVIPLKQENSRVSSASQREVSDSKKQKRILAGSSLENASLNNADMAGADLRKTNFYKADMKSARLHGANLQGANLERAFLKGADLSNSNLSKALLYGAKLTEANLSGANLEGANLFDADLEGANLDGANLKDANIIDANFNNATFSPLTTLPSGKQATSGWANLIRAKFMKTMQKQP